MFRRCLPLLALMILAACPGVTAQTAPNRINTPFSTTANGLVGPMIVDVPAGATRAAANAAVSAALRRGKPNRATADATYNFLVRNKVLRPGSALSFTRPVVLRENGRLRLPEMERVSRTRGRLGGGEITFAYEGWAPDDQARVDQFVQLMYPVAKQVYGQPSASFTLRIVRDETLTDATMHLRNGVFNATTNEIRFFPTGEFRDDMYTLTHLILYAFHDDALFAYDAWEEGFSWAATYVIFKHVFGDYDLGESFKTFYFLQMYELLNLPGVGNPRFWPGSFDALVAADRSAVFPFTLFVFRSAMAGAAWVKVYAENNSFFRDFNAAYYQRFTGQLAGHVPGLKAIASAIVPTVEGLSFDDWYRRQYILDTSVTPGRHLWIWSLPQFNRDDNAGAYLVLFLYHLARDAGGNEIPLGGTADLTYWSWDYIQDYFAEEGNQTTIPEAGNTAGVGAISPGIFNVGGSQKVNVQVSVGGLTRTVVWPYLVRGTETDPNDFFGATLETENGEAGVIVGSGQEQTAPVSQSAFGMKAGMNGWNKTSVRVTDTNTGRSITRQVNTGFDFYATILQGPRPEGATLTREFPAGVHLMSVPAYPQVADAEALGVAANRLRLAHWDPTLNGGELDYRYRVYPGTPPLAPGIGYWLVLDQATTVTFKGNPLPQDQSHLIQLRAGWNQIGHPFLQPVQVSGLRVLKTGTDTSQAIDLTQAVSEGLLSGTVWGHTQEAGFAAADQMEPWRGYWVRAEADVLLLVPAVASPGQSTAGAILPGDPIIGDTRGRARRARPADGWRMRLVARAGRTVGNLVVGASRTAASGFDPLFDAQRPPDMGDHVRLSVRHGDWGRAAGDYAVDVRSAADTRLAWDVDLETNLRNQEVSLQWPDLSQLPRDLRLTLVDLDGGARRYLRTTGSFTINSGETGRRRFRLEATRGGAGLLAITNIAVSPTRGRGGMDVRFDLSSDALVDAQIVSPSGRALRDVARSRALAAGTNSLNWDGRSSLGANLPAGVYLVQITATTEEGQSVRAVRPMVLTR